MKIKYRIILQREKLEAARVARVVQLSEAVGAGMGVYRLSAGAPSRAHHRPADQQQHLQGNEDGASHSVTGQVVAHAAEQQQVRLVDGALAHSLVGRLPVELESVRNVDRLDQQKVGGTAGQVAAAAPASASVALDGAFVVRHADHRLANWHAGCHQSTELHGLGRGELECVEVCLENLEMKTLVLYIATLNMCI